jgi:hypothetical protein
MGVTNQLGFAIAPIVIALVPCRRRERWSWWILLAFALLSTVALIPAALWHGSGPPAGAWVLIAACIAAMIIALAMTADVGLRDQSASMTGPEPADESTNDQREVGMTPKLFLRIQRFQRALAKIGCLDRAQVALACGYFDQSHLIRDFSEFAGITPAEYARFRNDRVKRDHIALNP